MKPKPSPSRSTPAANVLLLLFSILVALGLVEIGLRIAKPEDTFRVAYELPNFRNNTMDLREFFVVDPDFGFRPILGNQFYNRYGTRTNPYPFQKRPGVTRLLFLGDSVTARGKIIAALKQLYGGERYEYWNAGVESFNTVQEVRFYQRYNAALRPDHVIVTFHNNDFETTPVAFYQQDKLVVYTPVAPARTLHAGLFRYSLLYRWYLGLRIRPDQGRQAIENEIRDSLMNLRDTLARDHITLTVLIHPWLAPYQEWGSDQRRSRTASRRILQELGVRCYDLHEPAMAVLAAGLPLGQENDPQHPSAAAAEYFARYLFERGLLRTE